ncbi:MAG: energy transducer TonB [bacterium]
MPDNSIKYQLPFHSRQVDQSGDLIPCAVSAKIAKGKPGSEMNNFSIPAKYLFVCSAAMLATVVSFVLMTLLINREISQQPSVDIVHINAPVMAPIRKKALPEVRVKAEKILPATMPSAPSGKLFFPKTQTFTTALYPALGSVTGLVESNLIDLNIPPPIKSLVPMNIVRPHYPFRASVREIEGFVLVQFTVRQNGTVKNPFVIESEPGSLFDEAALSAISKFKFYPQEISGDPIEVEDIKIRFAFRLNSPYVEHHVEGYIGQEI